MSFTPQQFGNGSQPIALVSQLRQQAPQMQHIDELFAWMSHAMMSQWQIPLVQFWATQAHSTGQFQVELRTAARQNPSLPPSAHINRHVAVAVQQLLRERRGASPLATTSVFSPTYVELLARYDIHYWGGYYIRDNVLLPPKKEAGIEKVATPLSMVIALFFQSPPSERLGRAMDFAFQQGFRVAASKGLFSSTPSIPTNIPTINTRQQTPLDLSTLVPQRSQSIEELQTGNPFANAAIIADKKARQMYSLINGQRDVATLARLTNWDMKEVGEALRLLLQLEKIQLQDVEGNAIADSLLPRLF